VNAPWRPGGVLERLGSASGTASGSVAKRQRLACAARYLREHQTFMARHRARSMAALIKP